MPAKDVQNVADSPGSMTKDDDAGDQMQPLMVDGKASSGSAIPMGNEEKAKAEEAKNTAEFWAQVIKFAFCFCGLQASYLTWGPSFILF